MKIKFKLSKDINYQKIHISTYRVSFNQTNRAPTQLKSITREKSNHLPLGGEECFNKLNCQLLSSF